MSDEGQYYGGAFNVQSSFFCNLKLYEITLSVHNASCGDISEDKALK